MTTIIKANNPDALFEELTTAYPGIDLTISGDTVRYVETAYTIGERTDIDNRINNHDPAILTSGQQAITDIKSVTDFAVIVQNNSQTIKQVWLAIMQSDLDSDDTDTRLSAIATILNDTNITSTAFKNRYDVAFAAESGVSIAGLDLAALLLLTTAQRQRYISFARYFFAGYISMLKWSIN